jgi:hypothetical protein
VTCVDTTDCIAVGSPSGSEIGLAEQWDGTTWTALKTPNGTGNLESVSCTSATSCVAVGESLNDLQVASPLIYSWNGTKWTTEASAGTSLPNLGLTGVSCTSPARCLAVGYAIDRLGSPEAFSEIWNGSTWAAESIPTPRGGAEPEGVQCSSAIACVTVGARSHGAFAEGWDGAAWTVQKTATPVGAGTSAAFEGVTCAHSVSCTAVGSYSNSSGLEPTLAEAT